MMEFIGSSSSSRGDSVTNASSGGVRGGRALRTNSLAREGITAANASAIGGAPRTSAVLGKVKKILKYLVMPLALIGALIVDCSRRLDATHQRSPTIQAICCRKGNGRLSGMDGYRSRLQILGNALSSVFTL
jgi:hypothetical protein